ncbi:MAG TPA: extracellular solute-binding protein [Methylomirabilota bacterium]|jgi:multiple sugar transport system substrate-binding protein
MNRRDFLKDAGIAGGVAVAGVGEMLAARRAPAFAQGTRLHILRWVDFIPACDVELKRQAGDAGKALGAEVQFEFINANDLQPRITAAIQSGGGPDIIMMLHNWPHLYANGVVDVSDLAEWQVKDQGAYYGQSEAATRVGGKFLALPHGIVGLQMAYRKSWFREIGQTMWPRTLEELRLVGMKLKKKGRPIGQTLAHTFGDAPAWAYPLMWSFGGAETDRNGATALGSKGTVESVKFMQAFWKDACDEGALAWDDTNNNRAFLAGEIACTLNGASIYIAAKRGPDKIKDERGEPMVRDIDHGPIPAGPAGSSAYHVAFSHAVMKYGRNQKLAKDFLKWLHGKEQFSKWFEVAEGFSVGSTKFWEQHPLWTTIDPPMKIYRQAAATSRMFGYAGPPSAKATEAYSKYIIVDMYAKAVQGLAAEDAVKWAAGELKKIYG